MEEIPEEEVFVQLPVYFALSCARETVGLEMEIEWLLFESDGQSCVPIFTDDDLAERFLRSSQLLGPGVGTVRFDRIERLIKHLEVEFELGARQITIDPKDIHSKVRCGSLVDLIARLKTR